MTTNQPFTITPGNTKKKTGIHPYMMNNWKGTKEIQETFKKISKKP